MTTKLDAIDIKLIKDLLYDGRKSFVEIAEECNVTNATIGEHYSKLRNAGIIVGATTLFNYEFFGFNGVATLLLNVESQHLEEMYDWLKNIPEIYFQRQYNAEHNIMVFARWKTIRDLDHIKEAIKRKTPIIECKIYFWTDVINIPENLTIGFSKNNDYLCKRNLINTDNRNACRVDNLDNEICKMLTQDGRLPFSKIAKKIGISTDVTSKRYTRLKENNIMKSVIQINPNKLGYNLVVHFNLAFTFQENIKSVIDTLVQMPNISYIVKVEGGDFDIHVVALARDASELIELNTKISRIPHIKKLETSLRIPPPEWPSKGQYISTFS